MSRVYLKAADGIKYYGELVEEEDDYFILDGAMILNLNNEASMIADVSDRIIFNKSQIIWSYEKK
jgi:hypothetical protein